MTPTRQRSIIVQELRGIAVIAVILFHAWPGIFKSGYLGVDLVIDQKEGPLMLELNARPGLNIQIANREGVLSRYKLIEERAHNMEKESVAKRIQFSQQTFGV